MSILLGLTISYEPYELIEQAIKTAIKAYNGAITRCFIQTRTPREKELQQLNAEVPITITLIEPYAPTFIAVQCLIDSFLETDCDYLIKTDADTLIFDWDGELYDLAGERIYYTPERLKQRYYNMPIKWQQHMLRLHKQTNTNAFQHLGTLTAIQGGYLMMSKKVAATIAPFFYRESTVWNDIVWSGEEQVFGYYFLAAKILSFQRQPFPVRLNLTKEGQYITALRKAPLKGFQDNTQVIHPVKNQPRTAHLISLLSERVLTKFPLLQSKSLPTLPKAAVYMTVSKETVEQVVRAIDFIKHNLAPIFSLYLINNHCDLEQLKKIKAAISTKIEILEQDGVHTIPTIPTFYRFQIAIEHFLTTNCNYFIKLDADTILLRSPTFTSNMFGQFLVYNKQPLYAN